MLNCKTFNYDRGETIILLKSFVLRVCLNYSFARDAIKWNRPIRIHEGGGYPHITTAKEKCPNKSLTRMSCRALSSTEIWWEKLDPLAAL